MTAKTPRKKKPKLKVIEITRPGRYIYETYDGVVTVYGKNGEELTNERILWLLEYAKRKFMETC